MDRAYKEDIPRFKKALSELQAEFSAISSRTNWSRLRIEPLLRHVAALEALLCSPKFTSETARLRAGVSMFRSDLIYLRTNIKALKDLLAKEKARAAKSTK